MTIKEMHMNKPEGKYLQGAEAMFLAFAAFI